MSAAAAFPGWAILEPFVFRRDDDDSFPDETKAPVRASGTTSFGAPFRIAFSFADPPRVSRLYAQLPGFPGPDRQTPLAILMTHRHLALLGVSTMIQKCVTVQDFFIYSSAHNPSSLQRLPPCGEPYMDMDSCGGGKRGRHLITYPRVTDSQGVVRRLLPVRSMGLVCRGEGEQEFAVAELKLFPRPSKVCADIFFLKSAAVPAAGLCGGKWRSVRVPILHSGNPDDIQQLRFWLTDCVVPIDRWLCWVDYSRGMLLCDLFREPKPTVSFLRFPLDKVPGTHNRSITQSRMYRGVSVIDAGRALKFVNVTRSDDHVYGAVDDFGYKALEPGASFTITCHTLSFGGSTALLEDTLARMRWIEDSTVTSDELLWTPSAHGGSSPADEFPHDIVMFPQVNSDRPHVVHFLISSYGHMMKKMWLVSIDMSTKTVESFSQYINGKEDLGTVDADLTRQRSTYPMPFLPCELSKYLHPSRESKDME